VIDIHHADSLIRLAERYDTAIIHTPRPEGDLYHVVVYRYAQPSEAASDYRPSSLRGPREH
jgi:hypothetical protein